MAPRRNTITIPTTPRCLKFCDLEVGDLFMYSGMKGGINTVYMKIRDEQNPNHTRGVSLASGSAFIIQYSKELIRVSSVLIESKTTKHLEEEEFPGE